jgi:ABC-2 type transport system ATP-binding protein
VSLRFEHLAQFTTAQPLIAALPGVADVETEARDLRLTALPHKGAELLPVLSELITANGWAVPELHLEAGRLDEVFRTLTHARVATAPQSVGV